MADIKQPNYQGQPHVTGNEPAMQMTIRQHTMLHILSALASGDHTGWTEKEYGNVLVFRASILTDKLIQSWQAGL